MYSLVVYVPDAQCETVKEALFNAGAGKIGAYDQGCWQIAGQGQYRPLPGSQPQAGTVGKLHVLAETKLELVCEDHCIEQVVQALKAAHPYEEPPYYYQKVLV